MDKTIPDKTKPVVPNRDIIAQCIPLTADEIGAPKHTPQE